MLFLRLDTTTKQFLSWHERRFQRRGASYLESKRALLGRRRHASTRRLLSGTGAVIFFSNEVNCSSPIAGQTTLHLWATSAYRVPFCAEELFLRQQYTVLLMSILAGILQAEYSRVYNPSLNNPGPRQGPSSAPPSNFLVSRKNRSVVVEARVESFIPVTRYLSSATSPQASVPPSEEQLLPPPFGGGEDDSPLFPSPPHDSKALYGLRTWSFGSDSGGGGGVGGNEQALWKPSAVSPSAAKNEVHGALETLLVLPCTLYLKATFLATPTTSKVL